MKTITKNSLMLFFLIIFGISCSDEELGSIKSGLKVTINDGESDVDFSDGAEINFGKVSIGSTLTKTLTLKGLSSKSFEIIEIQGIENSGFTIINDPVGSLISRSSSLDIEFGFSPAEKDKVYSALVTLIFDGLDGESNKFNVNLRGEGIAPVLKVSPDPIEFGPSNVLAKSSTGVSSSLEVEVRNLGSSAIKIEKIEYEKSNTNFGFDEKPSLPKTLNAGDEFSFYVTVSPKERISYKDKLIFTTDDPSNKEFIVPISADGVGPKIEFEPTQLDFGKIDFGTTKGPETVKIKNTGNARLRISKFELLDNLGNFKLDNAPSPGFVINQGDEASFDVTYQPKDNNTHDTFITVSSNDPEQQLVNYKLYGGAVQPVIDGTPVNVTLQGAGKCDETFTVRIKNIGQKELNISNVSIGSQTDCSLFTLTSNNQSSVTLQPGETTNFEVEFKLPTCSNQTKIYECSLKVDSDAANTEGSGGQYSVTINVKRI